MRNTEQRNFLLQKIRIRCLSVENDTQLYKAINATELIIFIDKKYIFF